MSSQEAESGRLATRIWKRKTHTFLFCFVLFLYSENILWLPNAILEELYLNQPFRDKYKEQMMYISNKKEKEEYITVSFSNIYYWCLVIHLGKTLIEII